MQYKHINGIKEIQNLKERQEKLLNIENIGTEHAGTYRLEVTTTARYISKSDPKVQTAMFQ